MKNARAPSLTLQRNLVVALLIAIAAAAWTVLIRRQIGPDMPMNTPTMGMDTPLFLAVWIIMMIAMMFPTAAPMILTFHQVQAGRRGRSETFVSTSVFVGGYITGLGLGGHIRLCRRGGGGDNCRSCGNVCGDGRAHRRQCY